MPIAKIKIRRGIHSNMYDTTINVLCQIFQL